LGLLTTANRQVIKDELARRGVAHDLLATEPLEMPLVRIDVETTSVPDLEKLWGTSILTPGQRKAVRDELIKRTGADPDEAAHALGADLEKKFPQFKLGPTDEKGTPVFANQVDAYVELTQPRVYVEGGRTMFSADGMIHGEEIKPITPVEGYKTAKGDGRMRVGAECEADGLPRTLRIGSGPITGEQYIRGTVAPKQDPPDHYYVGGVDFVAVEEDWREYDFGNGKVVRIENPQWLNVKRQTETMHSHRLIDANGVSHYVPGGWVHIRWKAPENMEFQV
jgi:hypothetical protein